MSMFVLAIGLIVGFIAGGITAALLIGDGGQIGEEVKRAEK